ncbi:MAG: murein transglycosylase domain-containing protein [Desulfobacterales bacterium]|nr:murein transglycosylase domain-containing protein [Desulfobacterales bacterium]
MNGDRLKQVVSWGAALVFLTVGTTAMASKTGKTTSMQDEYEAYLKEDMDFQAYQKQVEQEFKAYKTILREEFKSYRADILKVWDKPEVSHKKRYVGYSSDYKVKKVVDFEKGTVKISAVVPEGTSNTQNLLSKHLLDLLNESTKSAFAGNAFATGVEKKLKAALPPERIQTAAIAPKPVVGDLFTGKAVPTMKETAQAVKAIMSKAQVTKAKAPKTLGSNVVAVEVKLPPKGAGVKAKAYLPEIKQHSQKRKLPPALILAVMETESAFNPMATSYVPAYGLMQIVPKSAGRDASKLVLGKDVVLSPSYLYNGKNNIAMGTAYLYILNDRYLASIKDPMSRLYCVIAAYNTGAGNVARAFTGTTSVKKAAPKINAMTPEKVYQRLMRKLPHQETRDYLKRVTTRMKKYESA